ncbi:CPBP family intramembrane glutamic endopeptidase [Deinococcus roseus]|uniref:CAAX prenyl protease 2/Lysostaphin resistance protein A-like domain-containing protein n=1 Tax=Deinococcus roseus TaxID=392414 RepID=A0ABQ2D5C8_9DEIO|nr:CPBP family intramembrane glutamic endopeptidase [Deinococcus roseus]GGJ41373.1 hypothetical protein GCM10008938_29310 [Deinococcus roseus]
MRQIQHKSTAAPLVLSSFLSKLKAELQKAGVGAGLGLLLFSGIALVVLTGNLAVHGVQGIHPSMLAGMGSLFFAALMEEILFRGLVFSWLQRRWGLNVALVGSGVLFSLVHLLNPGSSLASLLGVLIAGAFFAVLFARYRSLGLNTGLHWGWNYTQGAIWGLPVSGWTEFTRNPLLDTSLQGHPWLTGGSFGMEASWVTLLTIGLLTIGLYRNIQTSR